MPKSSRKRTTDEFGGFQTFRADGVELRPDQSVF